ncbi:MAG: DNA primase [Magnetococcus sp. WYHC-3]
MSLYPDDLLESIRQRTDMLELVSQVTPLKRSGANWSGLCPFHQEKNPSFSVRPDKGVYKCFSCGAGGDLFEFVERTQGLSFPEAVRWLAQRAGVALPEDRPPSPEEVRKRQRRDELLEVLQRARSFYRQRLLSAEGAPACRYLDGRGIGPEVRERFGIGYAPPGWRQLADLLGGGSAAESLLEEAGLLVRKDAGRSYDRFRERVIFPIEDVRGQCLGFGGRVLRPGDDAPKYINSPETAVYHKGDGLYGLRQAAEAVSRTGSILVVEGYMDVVALAAHGVHHAVATLGTALTDEQLALLWRRTPRPVFCFDGDAAGRKAAWRALEKVMHGLTADRSPAFLFLPQGEDPDSLVRREGSQAFLERLEHTRSPAEFLFQALSSGQDLERVEVKARLMHAARPLINGVADTLLRDLMLDDLARKLDLPRHGSPSRIPQRAPWRGASGGGRAGPRYPAGRSDDASEDVARELQSGMGGGRPYEQVLLALLLAHPALLFEHEEELSGLELSDPRLSLLIRHLIDLAIHMTEPPVAWPLERLADAGLRQWAASIAAAESEILGNARIDEEFVGCLATCQWHQVNREYQRLNRALSHGGQCGSDQWSTLLGLKAELARLSRLRGLTTTTGPETAPQLE